MAVQHAPVQPTARAGEVISKGAANAGIICRTLDTPKAALKARSVPLLITSSPRPPMDGAGPPGVYIAAPDGPYNGGSMSVITPFIGITTCHAATLPLAWVRCVVHPHDSDGDPGEPSAGDSQLNEHALKR